MTYRSWLAGAETFLGHVRVSREEIVDFATAYDPQPFHTDDEAARQTHFGGLCASGWHTAALWMRHFIAWAEENAPKHEAEFGVSPGFRDMKWIRPVYAGDELRFFSQVTASRPAAKRPGYLMLKDINWADNQGGVRVFEFTGTVFVPDPDML